MVIVVQYVYFLIQKIPPAFQRDSKEQNLIEKKVVARTKKAIKIRQAETNSESYIRKCLFLTFFF